MTAIREQILAHIFTQLGTLGPAVKAYRDQGYDVPIVKGGLAVSLEDGGDSSSDDAACFGCVFKTMDITVQLRVSPATQAGVGPALDDLYRQVAIVVLADFSQGGVAIDTHDGGQGSVDVPQDGNLPNLGAAEARFSIEYQHAIGRPDLLFSP